MNTYYNPVKSYIGLHSINHICDIANGLHPDTKDILLIHRGNDFSQSEEYQSIIDHLKSYQVHSLAYTSSNPSLLDVVTLKKKADLVDYSIIIAVGGGSIIDISKALKALKGQKVDSASAFKEILLNTSYREYSNKCSLIAIPTTTGTGSEVTPFASMWDKKENKKYSLSGNTVYAEAAIIDASFLKNIPLAVAVSTSLDALCHATESFWAKSTNYISRMYALKAISLLVENIEVITTSPNDLQVKENLLMGSFFAGLAFSNTKTTSCHSISYPLTMMFKIPHGIAAFLTLSKMYEFNKDSIDNLDELKKAYKTDNIPKKIKQLNDATNISPNLSSYGIKASDISDIVDKSFTKGRMDNNPITVEKEDLEAILNSLL